jgi:lipopolysaccharide transport system permease protein
LSQANTEYIGGASDEIATEQSWDIEIKPVSGLWNFHFKEVWNYRDLLMLLVRRDVVSFYKQTVFGPLWFFIQPIFTTIIYWFIFGRIANINIGNVPKPLFFLTGVVAWNYFSECLTKTSTVFRDNANIFGKVYFPRLIMPLSIIASNLVKFSVQLLLLVIMMAWYLIKGDEVHPNSYALLFPVIVLLMALQSLGWGLLITAMTTKYRDLAFLVAFGVQLAMYATPIVYPLSATPKPFDQFIRFNPLSGLVETLRYGLLGSGQFYAFEFWYSVAASVIILIIGVFIFNKVEKNFVDTV